MTLPDKLLSYIGASQHLGWAGPGGPNPVGEFADAQPPNEHYKVAGSWPWPISSFRLLLAPAAVRTGTPLW